MLGAIVTTRSAFSGCQERTSPTIILTGPLKIFDEED